MENEYPISCEVCGKMIVDFEDDWNNMCEDCYDTPPPDEEERLCMCGAPLFFGQSECANCQHNNQS